ncbi:MAG: hypothetical protein SO206_04970 [Bacilli bacterium]|nr:hypothetical protein [Bacilli bacterium]
MEIIALLYEANELEIKYIIRLELIRKAKAKLKTIDFLSSIAKVASCLTDHQHDVILRKSEFVQNSYVDNYLFPLLENKLIYDNAAFI